MTKNEKIVKDYMDRLFTARTEGEQNHIALELCDFIEQFDIGAEYRAKIQRIRNAIG